MGELGRPIGARSALRRNESGTSYKIAGSLSRRAIPSCGARRLDRHRRRDDFITSWRSVLNAISLNRLAIFHSGADLLGRLPAPAPGAGSLPICGRDRARTDPLLPGRRGRLSGCRGPCSRYPHSTNHRCARYRGCNRSASPTIQLNYRTRESGKPRTRFDLSQLWRYAEKSCDPRQRAHLLAHAMIDEIVIHLDTRILPAPRQSGRTFRPPAGDPTIPSAPDGAGSKQQSDRILALFEPLRQRLIEADGLPGRG